jgi:hypothetical protein
MSFSSLEEVKIITGINLVRSLERIYFNTSKPSLLGIFKSSKINLGKIEVLRYSTASTPSFTTSKLQMFEQNSHLSKAR